MWNCVHRSAVHISTSRANRREHLLYTRTNQITALILPIRRREVEEEEEKAFLKEAISSIGRSCYYCWLPYCFFNLAKWIEHIEDGEAVICTSNRQEKWPAVDSNAQKLSS